MTTANATVKLTPEAIANFRRDGVLALRMTAEDGVIRYRGDWAKEERALFEAADYRDGDAIAGDFFSQLCP